MLFLFKYIDDLIGKGFEWYVILQLLWYASATNVAMALPLAMLLSSIMTFGSLGENYELVAIKSSGVSLNKAMRPLLVLVTLMSIGAFLFSDYMLPVANLKMGSLLYDVRNQKAAFLIENGIFNNSIPGYSIRVQKKDKDGRTLHNLLIYDQSKGNGNNAAVLAKSGLMYKIDNDKTLVILLKDGVRYEESAGDKGYSPRQRFTRFRFKETEQKFDLSAFAMQRTDENLFKGNYAMLNLRQLNYYKDSTSRIVDSAARAMLPYVASSYKIYGPTPAIPRADTVHKQAEKPLPVPAYNSNILEIIPAAERSYTINNATSEARAIADNMSNRGLEFKEYERSIRRYIIEYNRKFTLSVSCLILFSIGAPLGAIIRKGGLGLPVVMSIIFFLIYHIISTIGEKSAKEGTMSPIAGMWMAIVVLAPLGAFLTWKATSDSALFDLEYYKLMFQKFFARFKKKKEQETKAINK